MPEPAGLLRCVLGLREVAEQLSSQPQWMQRFVDAAGWTVVETGASVVAARENLQRTLADGQESVSQTIQGIHHLLNDLCHLDSEFENRTLFVTTHHEGDADSDTSPEVPSLVAEYFNLVADAKLLEERLHAEIPRDHAERMVERNRLRHQAAALDVTEEQFQQSLSNEIQRLQQELAEKNRQIWNQYQECVRERLNPHPRFYRRRGASSSSDDDDDIGQQNVRSSFPEGQNNENGSP